MSELKRYRVLAGAGLLVPDPAPGAAGRMKHLTEGDEIDLPDDLAELHRGRVAPIRPEAEPSGESQFLSGGH